MTSKREQVRNAIINHMAFTLGGVTREAKTDDLLTDQLMAIFGYTARDDDLARRAIEETKHPEYNDKIAAIKWYRTQTDVGLKEAKDAIDRVWYE